MDSITTSPSLSPSYRLPFPRAPVHHLPLHLPLSLPLFPPSPPHHRRHRCPQLSPSSCQILPNPTPPRLFPPLKAAIDSPLPPCDVAANPLPPLDTATHVIARFAAENSAAHLISPNQMPMLLPVFHLTPPSPLGGYPDGGGCGDESAEGPEGVGKRKFGDGKWGFGEGKWRNGESFENHSL